MNRNRFFNLLAALLISSISIPSYGQILNSNELVQAGGEDMSTYMGHFVRPFMDAYGTGMNAGWYNTAENHKKWGFDLTLNMSLTVVPDGNKLFLFDENDYSNLKLFPQGGATTAQLPTLMGSDPDPPQQLQSDGVVEGEVILSPPFDALGGIEDDLKEAVPFAKSSAPTPSVQVGLGLFKNTDIIVRWTPYLRLGDAEDTDIKILGIGIKHDIKQWIPGLKSLPFHLSMLVAWNSLDIKYQINDTPLVTVTDGLGTFKVNSWTLQALVSKQISVITFYGGLGYNWASSNLAMTGVYAFDDVTGLVTVELEDPVNEDFKINGARFTGGARLKFSIFTLHADYTLQEYNTFTFGLGFSVR